MARVDYGGWMASAYDRGRGLQPEAVVAWEAAAGPFLRGGPPGPVLDLGAGTGRFSGLLAAWSGRTVVAVEPAAAMAAQARAKGAAGVRVVVGEAQAIPVRAASIGAAWLSQVIHHVPDLDRAAHEVARVVRPGGHVLLRGTMGGDGAGDGSRGPADDLLIYRYFPAAARVADDFPSRARVVAAFRAAGFMQTLVTKVRQVTAPSLLNLYERTLARADSTLAAIDDDTFAAGLESLRQDADAEDQRHPVLVVDHVDFVVLRAPGVGEAAVR